MKDQNCIDTMSTPAISAAFGLPPWLKSALRLVNRWLERGQQRRQLAALSDAALKDIGITRVDVYIEVEKPFWRP